MQYLAVTAARGESTFKITLIIMLTTADDNAKVAWSKVSKQFRHENMTIKIIIFFNLLLFLTQTLVQ